MQGFLRRHYAALLILNPPKVSFTLWLTSWITSLMQKYVKNQTHVLAEVFPRSHLFRHSGHPTNLLGFKLILSSLWIQFIHRWNFGSHGDLQKQSKTHFLALQWAIVFKTYCSQFFLYLSTDRFYSTHFHGLLPLIVVDKTIEVFWVIVVRIVPLGVQFNQLIPRDVPEEDE